MWTPCYLCSILLVSWKLGWAAGSTFLERDKEVHTSQKNMGSRWETWVIPNASWTLLIPSWIHIYLFICSLFQIRNSSITIACIELCTNQSVCIFACQEHIRTLTLLTCVFTQDVNSTHCICCIMSVTKLRPYLSLHRRWSSVWACWPAKGDICPAPTCLLSLAG